MNHLVIHDEPLKVLLKDTISEPIAELVDDSVKARFGGVSLPTAIEDSNKIITNFGDQVTMQAHLRNAVFSGNRGVGVGPVLVTFDGSIHELFDLTHVVKNEVNLFDSFNIEHRGESCNPPCATLLTGQRTSPHGRLVQSQ